MMKLYCITASNKLATKQFVLDNPNIHGVSINIPYSTFFGAGGGFNGSQLQAIIKELKRIGSYNAPNKLKKKARLRILFGDYCRNIPNVNYLDFTISRHNGEKPPTGISVPKFWEIPYLSYFHDFVEWFYNGLQADTEAYNVIEYIDCTGINEQTGEFRVTHLDYLTTGGEPASNAAIKWIENGYSIDKLETSIVWVIGAWSNSFQDKQLCLNVITGLNGFPMVTQEGTIGKQPDTSKWTVENVCSQYEVLAGFTAYGTHPPPLYISKNPCSYQLATNLWGNNVENPPIKSVFEATVADAASKNGVVLEIYESSVQNYLT